MKYIVERIFSISIAHKLVLDYESKCNNLHGHNYTVTLSVESDRLDKNGMVIDFNKLKLVEKIIKTVFDHKLVTSNRNLDLRKFIQMKERKDLDVVNTTSELLAEYFAKILYDYLKDEKIHFTSIAVKVSETDKNSAIYIRSA